MLAVLLTIGLQTPAAAGESDTYKAQAIHDYTEAMSDLTDVYAYVEAVDPAMACPVPSEFVSSFGAPRTGHLHQGVDMMADHGTIIVSPASGLFEGDGESFYVYADDGTTYFGTHNGGDLVPSGSRVTRGQPISTVSNTGNASGGASHLHFEIHPGGGSAVDPYPATLEACSTPPSPAAARTAPSADRITPAERRFCAFTSGGRPSARFVACLHHAEGHQQGTQGHLWVDYQRQARQLRAFLRGLVPPIPYEANWDRVAACESGGNWSINTGNGYYGGLQYDYGTWLGAGGGQYAPRADLASKREQILISEQVRADRGLSPWPHCGPRWYG